VPQSPTASFEPVARNNYLERLSVQSAVTLTPDFWTQVHEGVQQGLLPLESEVRQRLPKVEVTSGRTRGEHFYLFSYLTFSLPDHDLDSVVAGLTFTSDQHGGVVVEADVSGEQTGDFISCGLSKTVAHPMDDLLAVARGSASMLHQFADAIADALVDRSRRAD